MDIDTFLRQLKPEHWGHAWVAIQAGIAAAQRQNLSNAEAERYIWACIHNSHRANQRQLSFDVLPPRSTEYSLKLKGRSGAIKRKSAYHQDIPPRQPRPKHRRPETDPADPMSEIELFILLDSFTADERILIEAKRSGEKLTRTQKRKWNELYEHAKRLVYP